METALYMRVRGRVLGPYDQEKLQGLARRGQLSRMHELSPDGVTWVRASNFPELFTIGQSDLPPASAESDGGIAVSATSQQAAPVNYEQAHTNRTTEPAHSTTSTQWFYTCAGVQRGPVDFTNLQMLVGTGQLSADDLVWTEGMGAWTPARGVPGLIRSSNGPGNGEYSGTMSTASSYTSDGYKNPAGAGVLPEGLIRSAVGSRGWVLFIAVSIFILAALFTMSGIFWLVRGARLGSTDLVGTGVTFLIFALGNTICGILLTVYASRLNSVRIEPRAIVLEKCMDSLRALWVFLAISIIVILVLFSVVIIYSVATGAAAGL